MKKINTQELIEKIEAKQMKKDIPDFGPGDTITVHNRITEGNKTRIQKYTGIVLRRRGRNLSESCIIRKESDGVYVELTIQLHSPLIEKIEVVKKGHVRRAYISYLRQRTGKSARISEKK